MKNLILKSVLVITLLLINCIAFSQETVEEELSPIRTRNIWYGDVQHAAGLKKGEGVFRGNLLSFSLFNDLILNGQFRYGITDHISIGLSGSYFIGIRATNNWGPNGHSVLRTPPMTLTVEYNKSINQNLHIAGGVELFGNTITTAYRSYTFADMPRTYITTTLGNEKNNISLKGGCNIGLLLLDEIPFIENPNDVLWFGSIATKLKIKKNIDLISEFNVDTYERYELDWGDEYKDRIYFNARLALRFNIKERYNLDIGLSEISLMAMAFNSIPIPYVGVAVPVFNTKK